EAKLRTIQRKEKEAQGLAKPSNHVGNLDNYVFDRDGVIKFVESLPNDKPPIMRQIAINFKIKHKNGNVPENGGQIISNFLQVSKVDLDRFGGQTERKRLRIRKKKRRESIHWESLLFHRLMKNW
uniref:Uncharacterized protein n=1 Tax=Clytia hemisphaerica TaxID=252671 RepID=A0A7M5WKJ2_9CNID